MSSAALAYLALEAPPAEPGEAASRPWVVFRADTGFIGRAASLLKAVRLCGETQTDRTPRRLRNTATLETLEWTAANGWLTTRKARPEPGRAPRPPRAPLLADEPSSRYWLDKD